MLSTPLKQFLHPAGVYKLNYPAHWDQVQQDEGRSCGFGPHERDDVGLWISIMPVSIDTERFAADLPRLMEMAVEKVTMQNLRPDPTLRHHAMKADIGKAGEAGNYWIVAGGDVVLFASSQVPACERETWNPPFEKLMASLQITRDDELLMRQVANEVLAQLQERHPEQEFDFDEKGRIAGKNRAVFLSNIFREVLASPKRKDELIRHYVDHLALSADAPLGTETWEEVQPHVVPVLKPKAYIVPDSPTEHVLTQEWLADVLICYVIKNEKFFRFITGWDVRRWGTTDEALHALAIENLRKLSWPKQMEGARQKDGGRIIIVETGDSIASSRLLHPDLHQLFSRPLGSPFWAGIPDRDTLVVYSDRRSLKNRIARKLKKDCDSSAYPITPRPFLVTRDGVAAGPDA